MYRPVYVYEGNGDLLGFAIMGDHKLQSINIWTEDEVDQLRARIDELNTGLDLRSVWPHPQDPEVQKLLDDPNFHPIEYVDSSVIDLEKSYLVYEKIEIPAFDGRDNTIGNGDIVVDESNIVYKTIQIPKQPADVKVRLQDAMETVARSRL